MTLSAEPAARHVPADTTEKRGRDELNLAEFPLASLSDRVPDGQKTLEFSDTIWDQGQRVRVPRKLTISASNKFGLPTAQDDEVILALIQLTAAEGFQSRTVQFTRYQIIKQLGWKDHSRSYQRLELSLKRWLGVTLYYDRAWWSRDEQCWVNKSFHILSDLELLDRESRDRRVKSGGGKRDAGRSAFTWNEVVFRSFQAGNVKQIDMRVYREISSPIAKRMYRFLDKRFYHRANLSFDLRTFACEHVGLSKNYHTGGIKRKLKRAIEELEQIGFLMPMVAAQRFVKQGKEWQIRFSKSHNPKRRRSEETVPDAELVECLSSRGVTRRQAESLARLHDPDVIRRHCEHLDSLVSSSDPRVSRNPAGYLNRAITEGYSLPTGFLTKAERQSRRRLRAEQDRKERDSRRQTEVDKLRTHRAERAQLESEWSRLDTEAQSAINQRVRAEVGRLMGDSDHQGVAADAIRHRVLRDWLNRSGGPADEPS